MKRPAPASAHSVSLVKRRLLPYGSTMMSGGMRCRAIRVSARTPIAPARK